jgi:pimeloyl-ACP methyl ester carboxylesterase
MPGRPSAPDTTGTLRQERRRDGQQWILDWIVKTTGRTINFAYDQREVPPEVKTYRQIPRAMEKRGRHEEGIARAAEAAGNRLSACDLYYRACHSYHVGQHAIFVDDHPDKTYLHGKLLECFDGVMRTADHPIERVEIPWEGTTIQANFHVAPGARGAPTILFIPGMDMTKELAPDPTGNVFIRRGMNVLTMDGPGQGTSNLRKLRLTADNYERAASACIDWLVTRSEVDAARIGALGVSMGSYWSHRLAALDGRVKAIASMAANYGTKRAIFEEDSPRFKQVFMYMTGVHDETAFDRLVEPMHLFGYGPRVRCFSLMLLGEYDPLCHLEEGLTYFEEVAGPKELWVIENEYHVPRLGPAFGGASPDGFMAHWLWEALTDRKPRDLHRVVFVRDRSGPGPYGRPVDRLDDLYLPGRLRLRPE